MFRVTWIVVCINSLLRTELDSKLLYLEYTCFLNLKMSYSSFESMKYVLVYRCIPSEDFPAHLVQYYVNIEDICPRILQSIFPTK